jgi:hypothetical protein
MEIARNIARAIKNESNNGLGISPEDSETYTEKIEVKPQFLEDIVTEVVV